MSLIALLMDGARLSVTARGSAVAAPCPVTLRVCP